MHNRDMIKVPTFSFSLRALTKDCITFLGIAVIICSPIYSETQK